MAYNANALNVAVDTIGGGSLRIHGYRPTGESSEVFGAGYFTDAVNRGIRLGDIIVIITPTGAEIGTVSEITNGAATITSEQGGAQQPIYLTQPSVANAKIPSGINYITVLGLVEAGDHPPTRFKLKTASPTVAPVNNLAWVIDKDGRYWINDEAEIDARTLGIKGGARTSIVAGMTAGLTTLGATGIGFTSADQGKKIWATGFGTQDAQYNIDSQFSATIVSVSNTNNCVLDTPAATTATGQYLVVGWDDTIPISNACRAAATLGRWAVLPPGDFVTTGSVNGATGYSYMRCRGAGMTATRIISAALGSASTAGSVFVVTGGLTVQSTSAYLTAPAPAGTNLLTLNATIGWSVGSVVLLSALDQPQKSYEADYDDAIFSCVAGEVCIVRSVDTVAKTLLLESGLIYSYNGDVTIGLRSTVQRMDVGVEPSLKDLCIEHVSTSANAANTTVAFSRVMRPRVENVLFRHTGVQNLMVSTWIDGLADNCHFNFVGGLDALDTDWGYGVVVGGSSWNVIISNCIGWRCRHALTSGGAGTNPGPQLIHISHFMAYGCRISFDTHNGGRWFTFEDCHSGPGTVLLNTATPDTWGVGFQIRVFDTKLIGCTVNGAQVAYQPSYALNTLFQNCHAENVATGWHIMNSPGTSLVNCSVRNYSTTGVYMNRQSDDLTTMPNISVKGMTFYGNPTRQELGDPYTLNYEPSTFQLGVWDSTPYPAGNFISHYEDSWEFEDIKIYDAHRRWKGLPSTGVVYGALQQDTVLYQSMPRSHFDGSAIAALTSGVLYLVAIEDIPKGTYVSKLGTIFGSAGTTQTNLWFSLWDWNLNFLGVTSDGTTTEPTADVMTWLNVATPFVTNHDGLHYFGIMAAGAAMPSVYGKVLAAAPAALVPKLCGTSTTGLTTPASLPDIAAATSVTSHIIRLGTMEFTTQSGKAFTRGMPILIASNADPANFMRAYVSAYASTTLNVDVYEVGGSGTFALWDITAKAKATAITATANRLYAAVG